MAKKATRGRAPAPLPVTVGVAYSMRSSDGTPCHIIDALLARIASDHGLQIFDSGTGFFQGWIEFAGPQKNVDAFRECIQEISADLQRSEVDGHLQVKETNNWYDAG